MTGMCIDLGGPKGGCRNCPIQATCWVMPAWIREQLASEARP